MRQLVKNKTWRKVKLGEVAFVGTGGTPSRAKPEYYSGGENLWIKTQELNDGVIYDTDEKITDEAVKNSNAKIYPMGSVVLAMYGATVGKLARLGRAATTNQACAVIQERPSVSNNLFLFYALLVNRELIIKQVRGAAQQNLSVGVVKDFELNIPEDIADQKRIADILSAFDDKIELNNKISAALEQMVQAVFKEWFIGNSKFKSQNAKLSELVKTQYGYTESASDKKVGPKFLRVTDINKMDWIDWGAVPYCKISKEEYSKYKLNKGDVVIARMADPGKVAIVEEDIDAVFASYLIRLQIISDAINPYFLFYYLRSRLYQDFIFGASTGTTRQSANARVITDVDLAVPPKKKVLEFENVASTVRGKVLANVKENQKLAALRDLLLPKLMSGEINER